MIEERVLNLPEQVPMVLILVPAGSFVMGSPAHGEKRILRGGCFKHPPPYCRAANRYAASPDRAAPNFGFRMVWSVDGEVVNAQH